MSIEIEFIDKLGASVKIVTDPTIFCTLYRLPIPATCPLFEAIKVDDVKVNHDLYNLICTKCKKYFLYDASVELIVQPQ